MADLDSFRHLVGKVYLFMGRDIPGETLRFTIKK
jgi:hypothetical protein